jgi:serine/threonine protein kinase
MSCPKTIGQYKIIKTLGKGGFSHVYLCSPFKSTEKFAIKTCEDIQLIQKEYKILKHLSSIPEMIKIFGQGQYEEGAFMALEHLGRSLAYDLNDKILSLECVCAIGFELLTVLEKIHGFDVIHRDLKPSQYLISLDKKSVKLVDFGLSSFYKINGQHKEFKTRCKCRGTVSYASINNHLGFRQSRRDDLESFCYSLLYLVKGCLPWKFHSRVEGFKKWKLVLNQKINVDHRELFAGLPPEFSAMFKYVRNIVYDQTPNYDYLKSLLAKFIDHENLFTHFDWNCSNQTQRFIRKSQIVDGATVITRLRREKKLKKRIRKQKTNFRKSCQLRFSSTCGTIDRNNTEKIAKKRISFAKDVEESNIEKAEKFDFFQDFSEKKENSGALKKKGSCFLQLPTVDLIYCEDDHKNKRLKVKKTKKLTKIRSAVDLNEGGYFDDDSEVRNSDKKRTQEIKRDDSELGYETPRIPLPEFKDRRIIGQAKKFCMPDTREDNNSKCVII